MSNKQMTAVDFFGHNMAILSFKLETNNITQEEFNVELYNLLQQAKELEKQQIVDAFWAGDSFEGRATSTDFEKYYNEHTKDKTMSNKKETPVSWLVDELKKFGTHIPKLWFDKALQMESQKQQKYDEMVAMLERVFDDYFDNWKSLEQLIKEAKEL